VYFGVGFFVDSIRVILQEFYSLGNPGRFNAPGTVLGKITASGRYAAHDPAAVDGTETAVAVLWGKADASGGDAPAVAVVRGPAIVNRHDLVFAGTPSDPEIEAAHAALRDAGILVR